MTPAADRHWWNLVWHLPDRSRLGRRGAALLFFAFLDLVYGGSLIDPGNRPRGPQADASYHAALAIAPYIAWGFVWMGVGLICLVQAFMRRDAPAFAAAITLKVVWGGCLIASWLAVDAFRALVTATLWLTFAAFVAVISGWPEPAPRRPRR